MTRAAVRLAADAPERWPSERCFVAEVANVPDDPAASIARARVPPGTTTRWHRLRDTVERYAIESGTGRVEVEGLAPHDVGPGDVVTIPAMAAQRIANTGTDDLVFLAICTPRFEQRAYEELE